MTKAMMKLFKTMRITPATKTATQVINFLSAAKKVTASRTTLNNLPLGKMLVNTSQKNCEIKLQTFTLSPAGQKRRNAPTSGKNMHTTLRRRKL